MDEIRKYSKEWFVHNGTQLQKDAAKKMKDGYENQFIPMGFLDKNNFLGDKQDVRTNIARTNSQGLSTYLTNAEIVQAFGGVDNLFDLIDENADGKLTKEEISAIAAIDTHELADVENQTFSVKDLRTVYENVMAAETAKYEQNGNVENYSYEDGSITKISKNNEGKIVEKYTEKDVENNERQGNTYIYKDKIEKNSIIDSKGRVRYEYTDGPGRVNDKEVTIEYNDKKNRKTVKTDTPGRTITEVVRNDNKVLSKKQILKYNSNRKIENTEQQNIGECWVLAGVNGLRDTKMGQKIIKNTIVPNSDGSVTVKLNGINKSYTYSPEQIGAHEYATLDKYYAIGDIDMNLIEMAIKDFRTEVIKENPDIGGVYENATLEDPLNFGAVQEGIWYITGNKGKAAVQPEKIEAQLSDKQLNYDSNVMLTVFKGVDESITDGSIIDGHAYSIKRVTDDTVYVINPWDSSKEIAYPRDRFIQNCAYSVKVDLTK